MAMKSQNAYYLLLAIITILFVSIIFNFAAPILWSVVVSIIFYPVYEKFLLMTNKKSLSSILSLILILLLVIMPSIAILGLIGNELIIFINSSENYSFERYAEMIPDESIINELIGWSGFAFALFFKSIFISFVINSVKSDSFLSREPGFFIINMVLGHFFGIIFSAESRVGLT